MIAARAEDLYAPVYYEEWSEKASLAEAYLLFPGFSAGARYEMKIDDSMSAAVSVNMGFSGAEPSAGARLELLFYPQSHSLNAWFLGPFAGVYNSLSGPAGPVFFSLGSQAGYRWVFDSWSFSPRALIQYGLGPEAEKKISGGAGGFIYGLALCGGMMF